MLQQSLKRAGVTAAKASAASAVPQCCLRGFATQANTASKKKKQQKKGGKGAKGPEEQGFDLMLRVIKGKYNDDA